MKKLDWKSIKINHPKSFKKLVKDHDTKEMWGCIDHPDIWDKFVVEPHFIMRHLFDFFDENKIMISIQIDYTRVGYGSPLFCYSVNDFDSFLEDERWSELCRTRQEAEVLAFEESFKLLEKNLTKK